MLDEIKGVYRRAGGFARAMPLILLIPFAAEVLQHFFEVRIGMYANRGIVDAADHSARLAFGAIKSIAVLALMLFALRWWRFGRDAFRAATPDLLLLRGIIMALAVELGGGLVLQFGGFLLAMAGHAAIGSIAWLISKTAPVLLWAMLSVLVIPWYVALLTDDQQMGFRRSVVTIFPLWGATFGIYAAGVIPAMAVHYVLGTAAMAQDGVILFLLLIMDAGVVAFTSLAIASTYYAIYLRAQA